jgi:antitoxin ParD1/3/4
LHHWRGDPHGRYSESQCRPDRRAGRRLRAAVGSGEYATTSKIVRKAQRDWQFKHELRQEDIKRLRQLRDAGKASGSAAPFERERTIAAARARLKETAAR